MDILCFEEYFLDILLVHIVENRWEAVHVICGYFVRFNDFSVIGHFLVPL